MNQVARTFILVGLVVVILFAMRFLPTIYLGDNELRQVNILSDLLPETLSGTDSTEVLDIPEPPSVVASVPDTVVVYDSIDGVDTVIPRMIQPQTTPEGVTMIADYGQGQSGGMHHFYQQLTRVKELNRPVRIAYFGDSFVEGDILSCDLREQLQTQFGGNGVGWVDCASQIYGFRQTVRHSFEGLREYEVVKRPFNTQVQSIAQRYFTIDGNRATFVYQGSKSRKHLNNWQKATFFFRTEDTITVATKMNSDTLVSDVIGGDGQLQTFTKRHPSMHKIIYSVSAASPKTYLYGVALESNQGVIVDNFSMRGSSGVTLGSIPSAVLREFAAQRPYDLIIFHFGLNVANEKVRNYSSYIHQMGSVIRHFKAAYPQTSILVVSMTDRDQRSTEGIHTMAGVESLVGYQQIMAANEKVAFFNLFQAMGGRESMKTLVDKGYANKDYTHISHAGGRRLATHLVKSLLAGFDIYKQQQP